MFRLSLILIICLYCFPALAQESGNGTTDDAISTTLQVDSLISTAERLWGEGSMDPAIDLLNQATAIAQSPESGASQARIALNFGAIYRKTADYEKALPYFKKSLQLYREQRDSLGECRALEQINIVYQKQGQIERALDALFSVLEIKKKLGDDLELGKTYLNIGNCYAKNRLPEQAIPYYQKSKGLFEAQADDYHRAMALNNLANAHSALDQIEQAEKNYLASIQLKKSLDNPLLLASSLNNLGDFYWQQEKYNEAYKYFSQSLEILQKIEANDLMATVYLNLAYTAEELNNYEHAFDYFYQHDSLKTLLTEQKFNEAIAEFQVKFDTETKQNQILELEVENAEKTATIRENELAQARAQNTRNALLMGIGFLLIITTLALFAYRQKQKLNTELSDRATEISKQRDLISSQNEELKVVTETKEKLFSILAHNLRGPLASLTGFSEIVDHYLKRGQQEKFNKIIQETDQTVYQLHNLVNNMLVWANSQANKIPFNPERINLQGVVAQSFTTINGQANRKQVELVADIPEQLDVYTDINYAKTVLINLLNNAIKFTPEHGTVSVAAEAHERMVQVTVKDTGRGMSEEQLENLFSEGKSTLGTDGERGTGLGLRVCKEFVERGGGTISVKSAISKGSQFIFTWPLSDQKT